MKRNILTCTRHLAIVGTLIFFFNSHTTKAQEVLQEYLFEGGPNYLANWGGGYKGTYKSVLSWKEPFVASLDNMESHGSGGSLRIELPEGSDGLVRVHSPGIPIPPGNEGVEIKIRAYVRTEGIAPGSVGFGILEKTTDGKSIGFVGGKERQMVLEDNAAEWQEITVAGKLNSNTNSVIFMVGIDAQPATSFLLISNLVVEIYP